MPRQSSTEFWRILLIDDDYDDYVILKDFLNQAQGRKVSLEWASTFQAGEELLNNNPYDAVFVDHQLGIDKGTRLIHQTVERGYPAPMILLTGQGSYEVDLEAMAAGATFYLTKDEINPLSLERFIRYAIERKRFEDALAASEAKYRRLSESIQDGFIEVDRGWCFLYLNNRAASLVESSPTELIGRNVWEIFPALRGGPVEACCEQVMEQRQPASFEIRGPKSGKWFLIRVYPSTEGISVFWVDITESKRAEKELRDQTMQIELHHHLLEHREQERQRIAHELHDGPIQDLLALLMNIRFKQDKLTDWETKRELESVEEALNHAILNMRDMINEIRPPHLTLLGLAKAIQIYLDEFQCKHPEIAVKLCLLEERVPISDQARLGLFRILQESITNAVKHAASKRIEVTWTMQDHQALLEVRDEGKGFQVVDNLVEYSSSGHYGLVGMKERAEAVGGQFTVYSQPGMGTIIRVVVPVQKIVLN